MQSTYLKAFYSLSRFKYGSGFSTWLVRIMINECLHLLRRQLQFKAVDISAELPERVVSFETREEELIKKEMKLLLETSILALSPKYRSVYMLREVEGLSTVETAETLEISESNVKIRLHRAKEMLRDELIRRLGEVGIFTFGSDRCSHLVQSVLSKIKY